MSSPETLLNNLDEAVILFDASDALLYANRAAEELLGRDQKALKGAGCDELFRGAENLPMFVRKVVSEGRIFRCKDMNIIEGAEAGADVNIIPFYEYSSGGGKTSSGPDGAILCIRRNLSLAEQEDYYFDSLILLVGSIAHEIKNPLGGIKGAAQILKTYSDSPEAEECITLIIKESDRLNLVLNTYLTMTRKPVFNRVNIHEVLEQALRIVTPDFESRSAKLIKIYDPSLPLILGDEAKLLQVFINLFKNAAESLEDSGSVSVSTGPSSEYMVVRETDKSLEHKDTAVFNIASDSIKSMRQRWAVVDIKDTGVGIPSEDIQKVFLPFYTKKENGSGLGLALSKKIIIDHGGLIRIKSSTKGSTVVSVYLPFRGDQK
ncbi:MAG: ATP-binding protein [Dissulfurispiraceae bacterium]|jgi:two-component system nitrogen regulation sensor histidine kinase GlnL|nr:ATP-binding protein [Dissulfurispiraceae bacterium]